MTLTSNKQTKSVKSSEVERKWYVIDAAGKSLGRVATQVASILRGKHRPDFTPHADAGDFVVVINAKQVQLTGAKLDQKKWQRHSGAPGGLKETTYRELLDKKPEWVIEKAVWGMLPKNSLGRQVRSKLKVYADATHPHAAQKPQPWAN